jgi:hypothetical protein
MVGEFQKTISPTPPAVFAATHTQIWNETNETYEINATNVTSETNETNECII